MSFKSGTAPGGNVESYQTKTGYKFC